MRLDLDYVILAELHLLLRITDVLLTNLLDDAMETVQKEDYVYILHFPLCVHFTHRVCKITHLDSITQHVCSFYAPCCVILHTSV